MNILAFFAHPDDETVLAGGTLALLARQSNRVTLLCATRGQGGVLGEPPRCTREELGAVRENELRCAAAALGVANLVLMDYIDPTIGPERQLYPFCEDEETLARQVADEYLRADAQVLLSHGSNGEYGHPAHRLCNRASRRAVEMLHSEGKSPLLYTTLAIYPNHPHPRLANADDPADLIIDCATVLDQKIQAVLCHQTQHALLVWFTSEEIGRQVSVPEVAASEESLRRWVPPAPAGAPVQDALADLLRRTGYARDAGMP